MRKLSWPMLATVIAAGQRPGLLQLRHQPRPGRVRGSNPDGHHDFLVALRELTISYGKPVVYVHGDSHYFRVDKPLLDRNGNRIEHFTRVETPGDNAQSGSNDVQWVKATVDYKNPEVFSFEQEVVHQNMVPYVP
jgi:hypothetical protein